MSNNCRILYKYLKFWRGKKNTLCPSGLQTLIQKLNGGKMTINVPTGLCTNFYKNIEEGHFVQTQENKKWILQKKKKSHLNFGLRFLHFPRQSGNRSRVNVGEKEQRKLVEIHRFFKYILKKTYRHWRILRRETNWYYVSERSL